MYLVSIAQNEALETSFHPRPTIDSRDFMWLPSVSKDRLSIFGSINPFLSFNGIF